MLRLQMGAPRISQGGMLIFPARDVQRQIPNEIKIGRETFIPIPAPCQR